MADGPRRTRDTALGLVGAVAVGAVTAAFAGVPALAEEPDYPTWQQVERAKTDEAAAAAEADRVSGLIVDLQDRVDAAGRDASIATERFHRAKAAEDAARQRHRALAGQADMARAAARTSRMRAGLLAASVARRGDPRAEMLMDPGAAGDLLERLSTVAQLSARSRAIYDSAVADEREAAAAGAQADEAASALGALADEAQDAMGAAQRAGAAAETAAATEQRHADRLLAQLADLQRTSVRTAAARVEGLRRERDEAAAEQAAPVAPRAILPRAVPSAPAEPAAASDRMPSASPSPLGQARPVPVEPASRPSRPPAPTSRPSSPPAPTSRPSTPAAPAPVEPQPVAEPPAPAGPPNSAQAAAAVAFARDQVGDDYRFGGAGPSAWDCSGLSMQAYASIGLGIGGHSATAQYRLAAAQGRLAPIAAAQVGDLVFYTDGDGTMYHVAVYSGSGRMIEAPYPGAKVREVLVRAVERVAQVARPTA